MVNPNPRAILGVCMLMALAAGCGDDSGQDPSSETGDTSVPLEVVNALDTQSGYYHLEVSYAPDPPVLGEGAVELRISFVNSNPDLQGAAVVGANVLLGAAHTESDVELDSSVQFFEESLGSYRADVVWPEAGLWAVTVEVGAADRTDLARFGVWVEAE